jgi:hypothetical protein
MCKKERINLECKVEWFAQISKKAKTPDLMGST